VISGDGSSRKACEAMKAAAAKRFNITGWCIPLSNDGTSKRRVRSSY
jgi:hypothetical protein